MAKLAAAVHVRDPERHRTVLLLPGEEPAPRLAALVTNPACWEGGKPPAGDDVAHTPPPDSEATADGDEDTKPAAKKAASRPARGRKAAAEGTGGH